jgi:SAM-dependent methyltransferase
LNWADQERWNRKYSEKIAPSEITPDPFLTHGQSVLKKGRALEIACGFGDNAIYLAQAGFTVTAIDISAVGLKRARERADAAGVSVAFLLTDAEDFDYGVETFDLITVFYFLNRSIFPAVKRALKRGGICIYKTYTLGERRYRPGLNRDYLLRKGELKDLFGGFEILLYEEGDSGKEFTARCIVRRP